MPAWIIYCIGFMAQILFSWRFLEQWFISEKKKQISIPTYFWGISLIASFLLFVYGYLRDDFPIMLGQSLAYFIYIRNLQLEGKWKKLPAILRGFLWLFPAGIVFYSYHNNTYDIQNLFSRNTMPLWLLLLGSIAQVVFTLRFIYQWLYSEKRKESSLPLGFWILSLTGAFLIICYAIIRKDPVLLSGHIFGSIGYIRNLMIYRKHHLKH